jgi:hypothetical protein
MWRRWSLFLSLKLSSSCFLCLSIYFFSLCNSLCPIVAIIILDLKVRNRPPSSQNVAQCPCHVTWLTCRLHAYAHQNGVTTVENVKCWADSDHAPVHGLQTCLKKNVRYHVRASPTSLHCPEAQRRNDLQSSFSVQPSLLQFVTLLPHNVFVFFFILIPNYICNLFKNIQQKVCGSGRGEEHPAVLLHRY